MNLFDKVSGDIKTAMLARDKVRLEALRGIKKEFLEAKTAKGGDGELSDDAALKILFSSLDKGRPVVVYTNTGVKASMIWLALTLLDYDASIYSWKDWQANSASDIPGKTEGK